MSSAWLPPVITSLPAPVVRVMRSSPRIEVSPAAAIDVVVPSVKVTPETSPLEIGVPMVDAGAAVHRPAAGAGLDEVGACAAGEAHRLHVVGVDVEIAGVRPHLEGRRPAGEQLHRLGLGRAVDHQRVAAGAAVDQIGPGPRRRRPRPGVDHVVADAGGDAVGLGAADDVVVAAAGDQLEAFEVEDRGQPRRRDRRSWFPAGTPRPRSAPLRSACQWSMPAPPSTVPLRVPVWIESAPEPPVNLITSML